MVPLPCLFLPLSHTHTHTHTHIHTYTHPQFVLSKCLHVFNYSKSNLIRVKLTFLLSCVRKGLWQVSISILMIPRVKQKSFHNFYFIRQPYGKTCQIILTYTSLRLDGRERKADAKTTRSEIIGFKDLGHIM